jgi:protein ImuB
LQKTLGIIPDPQICFIPQPRFQHGLAFVDGVMQREMLLFPMKRLLRALDDYLRIRQLQCHTLQWQLFDAHRLQAEFSIELSRTQNRWDNLLELSRLKLDQILLENSVFSINLICEDFFEAAPTAQQLFPDENDHLEAAAALIERLQARLGNEALQTLEIRESHWPELAWQFNSNNSVPTNRRSSKSFATTRREYVPIGSEPASMPATVAANNLDDRLTSTSYRPLWLLPQSKPLITRNNQPCWPTPLTLLRGPERIGNHWWQEEENERDYYIARNAAGVVCWIYREHKTDLWFLHGLFS